MSQELSDMVKSQIEEILRKFPGQKPPDSTELWDRVLKKVEEKLPRALTALVLEVLLEVAGEELKKLGRSEPCKHWSLDSRLCAKGKEAGSTCFFDCEDYEPSQGGEK